jgi:hypothetical protein
MCSMSVLLLVLCAALGLIPASPHGQLLDSTGGTPSHAIDSRIAPVATFIGQSSHFDPSGTPTDSAPAQGAEVTDDAPGSAADHEDQDEDDGEFSPWLIGGILSLIIIGLVAGWIIAGRRGLN